MPPVTTATTRKELWGRELGGRETLIINQMGGRETLITNQLGGRETLVINQLGGRETLITKQLGGRETVIINQLGGRQTLITNQLGGREALTIHRFKPTPTLTPCWIQSTCCCPWCMKMLERCPLSCCSFPKTGQCSCCYDHQCQLKMMKENQQQQCYQSTYNCTAREHSRMSCIVNQWRFITESKCPLLCHMKHSFFTLHCSNWKFPDEKVRLLSVRKAGCNELHVTQPVIYP